VTRWGDEVPQRIGGPIRAEFLDKGEDPVEHDDDGDRHPQLGHAADHRQRRRGPQQEGEEVHHLCAEHAER
jgi:hypothetical protein